MNQTFKYFLWLNLNMEIHHSSLICCYNKATIFCLFSCQNYLIFFISFLLISFYHSILYSFVFLLLILNYFTIFQFLSLFNVLFCFRNIFLVFDCTSSHIMLPFLEVEQFFDSNQLAHFCSILIFLIV